MKDILTVIVTYGLMVVLLIVMAALVKFAVIAVGKAMREHEQEELRQQFEKEDREYQERINTK